MALKNSPGLLIVGVPRYGINEPENRKWFMQMFRLRVLLMA
jgi:hypothetical protein